MVRDDGDGAEATEARMMRTEEEGEEQEEDFGMGETGMTNLSGTGGPGPSTALALTARAEQGLMHTLNATQAARDLSKSRMTSVASKLAKETSPLGQSTATQLGTAGGLDDDERARLDVETLVDDPAAVADPHRPFPGLVELRNRRKAEHDVAHKTYQAKVVAISDELEVRVLQCSRAVQDALEQIGEETEELFAKLENQEHMVQQEVEYIDGGLDEARAICDKRRAKVDGFRADLNQVESDRTSIIGGELKIMVETMIRVAHLLPPEVKEVADTEAAEVNSVVVANRKSLAELLALMENEDDKVREQVLRRWEDCKQLWRELRHERAIKEYHEDMNSERFVNPPPRTAILNEARRQQRERHEGHRVPALQQLAEFDIASIATPKVEAVREVFTELTEMEQVSEQACEQELAMLRQAQQEEAVRRREDLRRELHRFAALKAAPDLPSHAEAISAIIDDDEWAEFMRKAGGMKPELSALRQGLVDPDIIYEDVVSTAAQRAALLTSGFSLMDTLEKQGKGAMRDGLKDMLERMRVASKRDTLKLVNPVCDQVTDIANVATLDEDLKGRLEECVLQLQASIAGFAGSMSSVAGSRARSNSGGTATPSARGSSVGSRASGSRSSRRSGAQSTRGSSRTSGSRRGGSTRSGRTGSAGGAEDDGMAGVDMVALRAAQRRVGLLVYACELPEEFQKELLEVRVSLETQMGCNEILDEVVEKESAHEIAGRDQEFEDLATAVLVSLRKQTDFLHRFQQKLCDFYVQAANAIETRIVNEERLDTHSLTALCEKKDIFEDERLAREEKLRQTCLKVRRAADEEELKEAFENVLEQLADLEDSYRKYHGVACFEADRHPVAVATECDRYTRGVSQIFCMTPSTEHFVLVELAGALHEFERLNRSLLPDDAQYQAEEAARKELRAQQDAEAEERATGIDSFQPPDGNDAVYQCSREQTGDGVYDVFRTLHRYIYLMMYSPSEEDEAEAAAELDRIAREACGPQLALEGEDRPRREDVMYLSDSLKPLPGRWHAVLENELLVPPPPAEGGGEGADGAEGAEGGADEEASSAVGGEGENKGEVDEVEGEDAEAEPEPPFMPLSDEELAELPEHKRWEYLRDLFARLHPFEKREPKAAHEGEDAAGEEEPAGDNDTGDQEEEEPDEDQQWVIEQGGEDSAAVAQYRTCLAQVERFAKAVDREARRVHATSDLQAASMNARAPPVDPAGCQCVELIEIDHNSLERSLAQLRHSFVAELEGHCLDRLVWTKQLDRERKDEFTEDLEERLRTHWPRRGRVETTVVQAREGELMSHTQKRDRHIKTIRQRLAAQEAHFAELVQDAQRASDQFVSNLSALKATLPKQTSLAGLQGAEQRSKKLAEKFRNDCTTRNDVLDGFVDGEIRRLSVQNEEIFTTCKPFREGGNYSERELHDLRHALQPPAKEIEEAGVARAEKLEALQQQQQQSLAGMQDFKEKFNQYMQELALREGLGQRYGAPRRNAQERLKTEMTRDDRAAGRVDELLASLEFICTQAASHYLHMFGDNESIHGVRRTLETSLGPEAAAAARVAQVTEAADRGQHHQQQGSDAKSAITKRSGKTMRSAAAASATSAGGRSATSSSSSSASSQIMGGTIGMSMDMSTSTTATTAAENARAAAIAGDPNVDLMAAVSAELPPGLVFILRDEFDSSGVGLGEASGFSGQVWNALLRLRFCLTERARYLACLGEEAVLEQLSSTPPSALALPTPIGDELALLQPFLNTADADGDAEAQQSAAAEVLAECTLSTTVDEPPSTAGKFWENIEEVEGKCRDETVALYEREGKADMLADGLPDSLQKWLSENHGKVLGEGGHRERSCQRTRDQLTRLETVVAKIPVPPAPDRLGAPATVLRDLLAASVHKAAMARCGIEKQFVRSMKVWQLAREKHEGLLRPRLGNPDAAEELQALCDREHERSVEFRTTTREVQHQLLQQMFAQAIEFEQLLRSACESLCFVLDSTVLSEDVMDEEEDRAAHAEGGSTGEGGEGEGEEGGSRRTRKKKGSHKSLKQLRKARRLREAAEAAGEGDPLAGQDNRAWPRRTWPECSVAAIQQVLLGALADVEMSLRECQAQQRERKAAAAAEAAAAAAAGGAAGADGEDVAGEGEGADAAEAEGGEQREEDSEITEADLPFPRGAVQAWMDRVAGATPLTTYLTTAHRVVVRERAVIVETYAAVLEQAVRTTVLKYNGIVLREEKKAAQWSKAIARLKAQAW